MIKKGINKNSPSIINVAWISLVLIVIIAYSVISLNTRDWLWFWPKFDSQPDQIILHCYGADVPIDPISKDFSDITHMVNESLSGTKRWDPLSLSESTYQDYQTNSDMMTLELHYPTTVRIHSNNIFFSNVDKLIIPLDGRHASIGAIFARTQDGKPTAGSLIVENTTLIARHIDAFGLCRMPEKSY